MFFARKPDPEDIPGRTTMTCREQGRYHLLVSHLPLVCMVTPLVLACLAHSAWFLLLWVPASLASLWSYRSGLAYYKRLLDGFTRTEARAWRYEQSEIISLVEEYPQPSPTVDSVEAERVGLYTGSTWWSRH